MQDNDRVPRWIVENDPSWQKTIDSNLGMLTWTKKGTGIKAVCPPTGIFCQILGAESGWASLADVSTGVSRIARDSREGPGDITKYLSSRYLNPAASGPSLDLRRVRTLW